MKEYRDKTLEENPEIENVDFFEKLKYDFDIEWMPSLYHIRNGVIISKFEYLSKEYYLIENEEDKTKEENRFLKEFHDWMEDIN